MGTSGADLSRIYRPGGSAGNAGQRSLMRFDPSSKPNGAIGAIADTGQPLTEFASPTSPAPLTISGGLITHTPYAGAQSAGYLQVQMPDRVRRMGALVEWPANALGVVALVIPSAQWSEGVLPNAGFHLSINGNGIWTLVRFTTGGDTAIADYTTHGRFDSHTWGTGLVAIEVWLDPDNQRATIVWPDGTATVVTSPYFASETADYAVWELFENNGATDVAASFGAIWADTAPVSRDVPALTPYTLSEVSDRSPAAAYNATGALSLDLAKTGVHIVTLVGNATSFTFANGKSPRQEIEVHFVQDATGSRTLAGSTNIKWSGGAAPVLTTTPGRRDIFRFRYISGAYYEISRNMNVG